MFKKCVTYISVVLAALSLGAVHTSVALAASSQHLTSSHSQHASDSGCKLACQAVKANNKVKKHVQAKKDDKKLNVLFGFSPESIRYVGVGILSRTQLWLRSSWVPPDKVLLSGYYSSSL